MSESLSDIDRLVLAYIKDYPARISTEIAKSLGLDKDRVFEATNELSKRNLIVRHQRVTRIVSPTIVAGIIEYYPA